MESKPVEGPRGPHLFRSSMLSANSVEYQNALTLSPITPRVGAKTPQTEYPLPVRLDLTALPRSGGGRRYSDDGPFRFTDAVADSAPLAQWKPELVAQSMLDAGLELALAEKFVENDITGAILMTLKFEDLKELGIPSFGHRTKIWEQIQSVKNAPAPEEERPETPIDEEPDCRVRRELREQDGGDDCGAKPPRRRASSRRKKPVVRGPADDIISPLESVSIVGIEQVVPKPHHCSKGENCEKFKRRQKIIDDFKAEHPSFDLDKGGMILMAGDPGNPATAQSLNKVVQEDVFRPVSDAIPSVVASSDVMGPGSLAPLQYLQEAALRNVMSRDPQDNVRQFLDFQTLHAVSSEVPPTPPFEIYPAPQAPHEGLRSLPKLSIPSSSSPQSQHRQQQPSRPSVVAQSPAAAAAPYNPYGPYPHSAAVSASPDEDEPRTALYRFASPFSEMDVPLTAVPLGPVARDLSQSVPPDMSYRHAAPPPRSLSRLSTRRPSFPLMPSLDENMVTPVVPPQRGPQRSSPKKQQPQQPAAAATTSRTAIQPPPRWQYPWTTERAAAGYEKAIAPTPPSTGTTTAASSSSGTFTPPPKAAADDVTYQGPMRKRKTKMLRHEWHDHFFTLKGTRLAMHKDARTVDRTLEYIDIDDYAIACSSLASSSKLRGAFKAMNIRRGGSADAGDVASFAFQLIPQDPRGGVRLLRKRESTAITASASAVGAEPSDGVNGTGKTHHFAVKNRDERIDWMRELMLAKALKQKGEGFEVSVNGNMI